MTSRKPCWWSKTKEFLSAGKWTLFWCKFYKKISFVLTTNMAALSRGCKRRITVNVRSTVAVIRLFGARDAMGLFHAPSFRIKQNIYSAKPCGEKLENEFRHVKTKLFISGNSTWPPREKVQKYFNNFTSHSLLCKFTVNCHWTRRIPIIIVTLTTQS